MPLASTHLTPFYSISKVLHTHTRFYTNQLLHQQTFTQTLFYTKHFLKKPTFTPTSFYVDPLLHRPAFTQTRFSTNHLLHQPALTQTSFSTHKLLPNPTFRQTTFYTNQPLLWACRLGAGGMPLLNVPQSTRPWYSTPLGTDSTQHDPKRHSSHHACRSSLPDRRDHGPRVKTPGQTMVIPVDLPTNIQSDCHGRGLRSGRLSSDDHETTCLVAFQTYLSRIKKGVKPPFWWGIPSP